jgi:tetratricopeptide (TPR) repeat protein
MTTRIEKTVFISYRRTNMPWALAIYQHLTSQGYDVFFDYLTINSGDFEKIIVENIKGRAHFIVILTPSALERSHETGDWLRREIETAMDEKRNIVPLMLENFDFGSPTTIKALTGKLENIKKYNALRVPSEYFFEAMNRLRQQFLNVALEAVVHPISESAKQITEEHQIAANEADQVGKEELSAQEWGERGWVFHKANNLNEAIRCYTEAIHIKQDFAEAFNNRGQARGENGDLDGAIADFNEAIRIQPDYADVYYIRGFTQRLKGDLQAAITDSNEAIRSKPDYADAYSLRGLAHQLSGDLEYAAKDYEEAIRLQPATNIGTRVSLINILRKLGRNHEADEQERLVLPLISKEREYIQACFEAICGNTEKALELLRIALERKQAVKEWAIREDPDFESIRNDPRFKELVGK